jgi:hypothetical protein
MATNTAATSGPVTTPIRKTEIFPNLEVIIPRIPGAIEITSSSFGVQSSSTACKQDRHASSKPKPVIRIRIPSFRRMPESRGMWHLPSTNSAVMVSVPQRHYRYQIP